MIVLVTAYLAMGVLIVTGAHRAITRRREWDWQDNVMTMLVVAFWPLMILLAVIKKRLSSRA